MRRRDFITLLGGGAVAWPLAAHAQHQSRMRRIGVQQAQVGAAEELLPELTMIAKERPDALFVYPDVVLSSYPQPQQLAEFAIKAHLPMMNAFRFFVEPAVSCPIAAGASRRGDRVNTAICYTLNGRVLINPLSVSAGFSASASFYRWPPK